MKKYVLDFHEIDKSFLPYVGGKGANLGEMTKAGFPVPQGFCVSTYAYRKFIQTNRAMNELFDQLDRVNHDQLEQIRLLGQQIREHLTSTEIPADIKSAILVSLELSGKEKAYAVRSSATAEDLPTASFAGQQDTYLNVCGEEQLLQSVRNCWASLFTDRAISYRAKNGFDHRSVYLSVVVQEMIFPEVAGIMFTADPITGHRSTVSIDASFGLGEALVSGLVTADLYQVQSGEIVKKQISKKEIAIYALPEGGTVTKNLPLEQQQLQALSDQQIIELAALGKKIEAHYGTEQDIEWGIAEGKLYVLQSRPITSLYPLPSVADQRLHVFVNLGYIQMMTDPMKPMAISSLSNLLNFLEVDSDSAQTKLIRDAGGRAFADLTGALSIKPVRNRIVKVLKGMDEMISSAIVDLTNREEFQRSSMPMRNLFRIAKRILPIAVPAVFTVISNLKFRNPEHINRRISTFIDKLVKDSETRIFGASRAERIRLIKQDMGNMVPRVLSKVVVHWISGVLVSGKLEKKLLKKEGRERTSDLLTRLNKSLPGNVTTDFGLELGDLADRIRNNPTMIEYLQRATNESFYSELIEIPGGIEWIHALESFLQKHGMRCAGEFDMTKPRWNEDPTQLIPSIISNIRTASTGEHRKKFEQGEIEAEEAGREIVAILGGGRQAVRLVSIYRHLLGMREHHKYALVRHYDVYKRAILEEAGYLVSTKILQRKEDVFYLMLDELIELLEGRNLENIHDVIKARESQHKLNEKLKSPRVMTSEGEIITGKQRNVKAPEGAITGTPVSAGVVEGIARVVLKPEEAKLNPGEILVAPYTDPGWTPLFTSVVGLVTEVGGMMTHGSVIAREYGIPAVVGIENATEIIKDNDYIRLDGTRGFVQIIKGD